VKVRTWEVNIGKRRRESRGKRRRKRRREEEEKGGGRGGGGRGKRRREEKEEEEEGGGGRGRRKRMRMEEEGGRRKREEEEEGGGSRRRANEGIGGGGRGGGRGRGKGGGELQEHCVIVLEKLHCYNNYICISIIDLFFSFSEKPFHLEMFLKCSIEIYIYKYSSVQPSLEKPLLTTSFFSSIKSTVE